MEKYKEIERSIIKKYRKEIWSRFVKAVIEYQLIEEGDNIMVCISGGKDSSVTAALCVEALGKDRVFGVLMPSGEQPDIKDSYLDFSKPKPQYNYLVPKLNHLKR